MRLRSLPANGAQSFPKSSSHGLILFGGFVGRKVLELGHTYMLHQLGATRIDAFEANTRAFLKCLVVTQILYVDCTKSLLGDFAEYLRQSSKSYDWVGDIWAEV